MKLTAESVYIASMCPLKMEKIMRPSRDDPKRAGTTYYELPIYNLDDYMRHRSPKFLHVTDTWQAKMNVLTRELEAPDLVDVNARVSDLMRHWAEPDRDAAQYGGRPAIWVASGPDVKFDDPESQAALEGQVKYFEYFYYKGQELAEAKKWHLIGENHRIAGLWLNKEEAWVKNLRAQDYATCPFCGTGVKPGVPLCANCHNPVRALTKEEQALLSQLPQQPQQRASTR